MNPADPSPVHAYRKLASLIDFPGRSAAVLFTQGCNFRCGFCHNPALRNPAGEVLTWAQLSDLCRSFEEQWTRGAVITGGEPCIQPGLADLVSFLREARWALKLDTNGSCPGTLDALLPQLDYVAMDIKTAPNRYAELTGWKDAGRILESIAQVRSRARDYEFRTTVIATHHTAEDMRQIARAIRGARRYVLQPFIPRDDLPDPALRSTPRTPTALLETYRDLVVGSVDEVIVRE